VGRVGLKAFVYFELVSTAALAIGLIVMHIVRPGEGIDASRIARGDVSSPRLRAPRHVSALTIALPLLVMRV
jgi:Na+/H+-dicarboxylate symporter